MIVGGQETTIDKFPHQVSLRYKEKHSCGGIIVSSKRIITAAHCTNPNLTNSYSILAGSSTHLGDSNAQIRNVTLIVRHPKYGVTLNANDIAVAFIYEDLEFNIYVQPISLPEVDSSPKQGDIAVVSGWGRTIPNSNVLPKYLQYVTVPVVSFEVCKGILPMLEKGMLCAGGESGKDSCLQDSGGPLSVNGTLVGVVSWGFDCGIEGFPGVYVHVSQYVEWILKTIL